MKYQGSCHCGRVAFAVEGEIDGAVACNCSICQRKGSLLWFVPKAHFHLQTPPENARAYEFNKHVIKHHFCTNCGIHPFAEGADPQGRAIVAVNIRCLEGLDLAAIPVTNFNGRAM